MDTGVAVQALAALAQESRLRVFRLLVREAPVGLAAGTVATRLGVPASTLSFHLQQLVHAGLVRCERQGRTLLYALREESLRELFWFLGEDCCQGRADLCPSPIDRIHARVRDAAAPTPTPRVLFLCSRNSARSQMAEAILKREAGERFEVCSGGLKPAAVHPLTLRVLEEAGYATEGLEPHDLGAYLGKVAIHHAIVVCEAAQADCPRLPPFALHHDYWPFPDPVAVQGSEVERVRAFRDVRDAIAARIRDWLDEAPRQPVTG